MSIEKRLLKVKGSSDASKINAIFEDIFNEYSKLVAFVIFKYVSTKEDVEDLVMDTFLNFYKMCLRENIDNIKRYLVQSAKNSAINFLKKQKRDIAYVDTIEWDKTNSLTEIESNDYYNLISLMEKVLSDREINIILLHAVYDYSFKDIASQYNSLESTIKSQYHRSIKKLKKGVKTNECFRID